MYYRPSAVALCKRTLARYRTLGPVPLWERTMSASPDSNLEAILGVPPAGKTPLDLPRVFPELAGLSDSDLRSRVEGVWQEFWTWSSFTALEDVPTSPEIPYSHVRHARAVIRLALAAAETFEAFHGLQLDRDVLVAAGLLQDVSKLVEYEPGDGEPRYSEGGRRLPHGFLAAHLAVNHGLPLSICEIIVSHSPTSSRFPASLEGKVLYYADQLDVIAVFGDRWRKELFITK